MSVSSFLTEAFNWAMQDDNIRCMVLVGSQARGTAKPDSDVDLVIMANDPQVFIRDHSFAGRFGSIDKIEHEDWGRVISVRVFYKDGLEVEFGFTDPSWCSVPLDAGTHEVLTDGYKVMADKEDYFSHIDIKPNAGKKSGDASKMAGVREVFMIDIKSYSDMVEGFHKKLEEVPEGVTGIRPGQDSWSLREIVGHLIDSASNNHQRFVRLQFDDLLEFPPYEAESWIRVQNYRGMDWNALVTLWYSYNRLLLKVIENMDEGAMENVWVKGEEALPLSFIVKDYFRHLQWHIGHFEGRLKEVQA